MKILCSYTRRVSAAAVHIPSFIVLAVLLGAVAIAPHRARAASAVPDSAAQRWKSECGSCHVAYPPRLLAAPAWRRLMSGLEKHFGTDASTDAQTAADIAAYLEQNAGTGRRASDTLRITEAAWFQRKHDEVRAATWQRPTVKSPANCAACHTDADRGEFRERNIRIPG